MEDLQCQRRISGSIEDEESIHSRMAGKLAGGIILNRVRRYPHNIVRAMYKNLFTWIED